MSASRRIEPRYHPRIDIGIPVMVERGGVRQEALLVNLSEGGALIRGIPAPGVGDTLDLAFSLPGQGARLHARGIVVRCACNEIAVEFDNPTDAATVPIRALVEARRALAWDGGAQLPRELAILYLPVIRCHAFRLARRFPSLVSVDDLVGVGFVALVEASRRFEPSTSTNFEAFARRRIRGAMLDELRRADPISRGMRQRKAEADAVAWRLTGLLGRPPDDEEVARQLDVSLEEYRACLMSVGARRPISIDDLDDQHDSLRLRVPGATTAIDPEADVEEGAARAESLRRVEAALAALPPRLRTVLDLYFGDELTMSAIGAVLGLTEGRISQLVSEGIDRVRVRFAQDRKSDAAKQ